MDLLEALEARHSVRSYTDKPLPQDVRDTLNAVLAECNHEGDLHMQLICDEPGELPDCSTPHLAPTFRSCTPNRKSGKNE